MKALKKLHEYCGDEDCERWIDKFELAVSIDGKQDKEAQLLSMYLDGPAYDTWKGLPEKDKSDASAIKEALRNVYGLRRQDAWNLAIQKKIQPGENVSVAAEDIMKHAKIACKGDPMQYVAGLMLYNALPEDIQKQVELNLGNDLEYSSILSVTKKIMPSSNATNSACAAVANRNQRITVAERLENVIRCYCCNRLGHLRKDCRIRCFSCGEQGHMKASCKQSLNEQGGASRRSGAPRGTMSKPETDMKSSQWRSPQQEPLQE